MTQLKPEIRFCGFKDSWVNTKLGEIAEFFSGGTPESTNKAYYKGTIPFIKSGEIGNEKTSQHITEEGLSSSSSKLVLQGDLLYALYGATSGEVAISKIEGAINQAVLCIRPQANRYFIYSLLLKEKSLICRTYLQGGQGNLSAKIIQELPIRLPSIEEQQQIADFLSTVDKKIDLLEKKKELLEQYKKGVMQQIFSQKIRFKDEAGNDYPEWEKAKLEQFTVVAMGQSPPSASYNKDSLGQPLIQGNADIVNRLSKPKIWTTKPTKMVLKNEILLTVRAPVGHTALSLHNACIGRGVAAIKARSNSLNSFIYQLLLWLEPSWQRLEQGSTFTAVSGNDIRSVELRIPSLGEQQKIADFLHSIDRKVKLTSKKLEYLNSWKKGLLQQMFV